MTERGRLIRATVTRDERVTELADRFLDPLALDAIRARRIGRGLVGGKAAGMLLAHAIVERRLPRLRDRLEPHDSFFLGSAVYRDYLTRAGVALSGLARDPGALITGAARARERILGGTFPEPVVRRLVEVLAHYGRAPIVVRSSSLLEDGFGDAFTGKYESVFCPNQGSEVARLGALEDAIRRVYASVHADDALGYREHRNLLDRDERMAVLIQRVAGTAHGDLHFPEAAGVALSHNPWPWSPEIDPGAGVARLVFGLGTRAVLHRGDDPTRLVALNAPSRHPDADFDEPARTQRRVDVIDLEANRLLTLELEEVIRRAPGLPLDLFATPQPGAAPRLAFERLLGATPFVEDLREVVGTLADAYGSPVDVEFALSATPGGPLRLHLLQCRPLQAREGGAVQSPPQGVTEGDVLLESRGPVIGRPTHARVDRVVFVDPDAYAALSVPDRNEVARIVGRLTRLEPFGTKKILLLGPGRWGTSTVALGVPVSFAQIQRASAIAEIVESRSGVGADVSLGSHFFGDLVEADLLYLAVYPDRAGYRLDKAALRSEPNRLPELLPAEARLADVVRVVDFPTPRDARPLLLYASSVDQRVLCYHPPPTGEEPSASAS